jgi:hypothetical protein
MEKCGCVAITANNSIRIRYCPLHASAPALLAALTEGIGIPANVDFAADLETMADQLQRGLPVYAEKIRAKAQAIRAAIAGGVR